MTTTGPSGPVTSRITRHSPLGKRESSAARFGDGATYTIRPRTVTTALACAIAGLTLSSLALQILRFRFGHDYVFGLVNLLNVDGEMNLPTWYASATLLAASALLWMIARASREERPSDFRYWAGLSLVFLYMSADEAAFLHERLNPVLRPQAFLPDLLSFGWVIAGGAAVLVVGLLSVRFVLRLAPPIRRLFVAAAVVYLAGALGMEMLGARHAFHHGGRNLEYALLATGEELLEMTGVAIFLHALLKQLAAAGHLTIRVSDPT